MQNLNYSTIVETLLDQFPEFKEKLNHYHIDADDLTLPHIVFAAFTRFFIDKFNENKTGALEKIIEFYEAMIQSADKDVKDLVYTELFENLWQAESKYEAIKESLGPLCKKELKNL